MFDTNKKYWFTVEPYVFITHTIDCCLLYNTLDGAMIEISQSKVIKLIQSLSEDENCGVVLFDGEQLLDNDINSFITELRSKFMGDIIDISFSCGKPIQFMPILNLQRDVSRLKSSNKSVGVDVMKYLNDVTVDFSTINIDKRSLDIATSLYTFFNTISKVKVIRLKDVWNFPNSKELMGFLKYSHSLKKINCSYKNISSNKLLTIPDGRFLLEIELDFPLNIQKWEDVWNVLSSKKLPNEIIFNITSEYEYEQAVLIIDEYSIESSQIKLKFTGINLPFFEENVFISKEDILKEVLSLREIFANQALNTFDFGKITVKSNGDVYANEHYPPLGNITTHTIQEMLYKEMDQGESWLRIRNQAPCNNCIYQWLCPSPSDYELEIGKPNLCHVK